MSSSSLGACVAAAVFGGLSVLLAASMFRSRFRAARLFCCLCAFNLAVVAALGAAGALDAAAPAQKPNPHSETTFFPIAIIPRVADASDEAPPQALAEPGPTDLPAEPTAGLQAAGLPADPVAKNDLPSPDLAAPVGDDQVRLPTTRAGPDSEVVGDALPLPAPPPAVDASAFALPTPAVAPGLGTAEDQKGFTGPVSGVFGPVTESKIIFVIDKSGSMARRRFPKVLAELTQLIEALPPGTEYQVFFFADGLEGWFGGGAKPVWQVKGKGDDVPTQLARFRADGKDTRPIPALVEALKLSPGAIYLLTDGEFTYGAAEQEELAKANAAGVPIHGTLVGEAKTAPPNTTVFKIATQYNGETNYVPD